MQTDDLGIGYRQGRAAARILLSRLNISLSDGELVCLLGPNGAGKSTLLRTLAGMQPPLSGHIRLANIDLHRATPRQLARSLGIVLTERVQPGLMTARDLVALGRYPYTGWSGNLTEADWRVVDDAIQRVSAETLAHRYVSDLSDGERQKIMVARALAQEPHIILLDEPTAFLDLPHRVEIMQLLKMLAHDKGNAFIISTHDLDLALRVADRIWLMPGDGTLTSGSPEDLLMSGALERAFSGRGFAFDVELGGFRLIQIGHGSIALPFTNDTRYRWTRRALERAGYTVRDALDFASMRVEITDSPRAPWRLYAPRGSTEPVGDEFAGDELAGDVFAGEFETLYDLVRGLRRIL